MDKQVSLKKVLAVVGVLAVLAGTFWAGMAYENHRIATGIEEAFSGFGDDTDVLDGDTDEGAPDAKELKVGEAVVVATSDYEDVAGELTVTLKKADIVEGSNNAEETPELTRGLQLDLKVQNTGDTTIDDPSMSGHFEGDDGKVYEFAGVMCDTNEMPTDSIEPDQFVEGCNFSDIPDGPGKFVFDSAPLFIKVPA